MENYHRLMSPKVLFNGMGESEFEEWLLQFPDQDTSGLEKALVEDEMYEFAEVVKKIRTST